MKRDRVIIRRRLASVELVSNPKSTKTVRNFTLFFFGIIVVSLFLPWQQNIRGNGVLTAFAPEDRPQTIESTIAGRIEQWYIREGQFVKKGDTIVFLSEIKDAYFDPKIIQRLTEEIDAKQSSISSTRDKVAALDVQIAALKDGLKFSTDKARNKFQQAKNKLSIDSIDLVAAKTELDIAKLQVVRADTLYQKGLISLVQYEGRKLKVQDATAKYIGSENKVLLAKNEVTNALIELNSIQADYGDKISKALSEKNSSLSYVFEAEGELAKKRNYQANVEVRRGFYVVRAPRDGYVVKAIKLGLGETIKEGEAIATITPAEPNLAAEVYIKAMDLPLVSIGNKVRLQFDGWPAIQFSGWPSVSVGTFGGTVAVIDMVDSEKSSYRILVVPDPEDEPWPELIRVGSGVYGWAMLKTVPVWYEIWRQLNGFPPDMIIPGKESSKKSSADKEKL